MVYIFHISGVHFLHPLGDSYCRRPPTYDIFLILMTLAIRWYIYVPYFNWTKSQRLRKFPCCSIFWHPLGGGGLIVVDLQHMVHSWFPWNYLSDDIYVPFFRGWERIIVCILAFFEVIFCNFGAIALGNEIYFWKFFLRQWKPYILKNRLNLEPSKSNTIQYFLRYLKYSTDFTLKNEFC